MAHGQGRNENNKKKSGPIPRFGEWEEANEMPITQYFENPRQAGLLHHHHNHHHTTTTTSSSSTETLKLASHRPRPRHLHPSRQTVVETKEKKGQQRRVRDVSSQTDKYYIDVNGVEHIQNDVAPILKTPKPVDEDLYKIPPELIHSSTRKKRRPSFLACLVPCA